MLYGTLFRRGPTLPDTWRAAIGYMGEAAARLEGQLGSKHVGLAAVIVRPESGQSTESAREQVDAILRTEAGTASIRLDIQDDELGTHWVIHRGTALKSLVRDVQAVGEVLMSHDMQARIVAAVFPFTWYDSTQSKEVRQYWIYQRRIGKYTPFVPVGLPEEHQRDQPMETRMEKALRRELPTEKKMSEWYPLWGMPI